MAIINAEFLPTDWKNRSVVARLNETLAVAEELYASVAFWTVGPGYLHPRLTQLLGRENSFCCVDLRGHTKLAQLQAFHAAKATRFFLFIKRLVNSSELGLNRHLLHTKLLLFDLPGGQAELWTGSHNFTDYALAGGNREASVVLRIAQNSALYQQAKAYLQAIWQECKEFQFNPALLAEYQQLQGTSEAEPELECYVLPLYWNSALPGYGPRQLTDQTALLLSNHQSAAARLNDLYSKDRPLLVWAFDLHSGAVSLWNARVQNAARIDRTPSSWNMRYPDRLLAVLEDSQQLPYLAPRVSETGPSTLSQFAHAANLLLYENVTDSLLLVPPPAPQTKAHWQRDEKATAALHQQLRGLSLAYPEVYGLQVVDATPETGLNATGWLTHLQQETTRKHRNRPGKAVALPVVERPVFAQPTPNSFRDPLQQLTQLTAAERQALQMRYEQPLRQRYFNERPVTTGLLPPTPKLPVELLKELLLKYQLLLL